MTWFLQPLEPPLPNLLFYTSTLLGLLPLHLSHAFVTVALVSHFTLQKNWKPEYPTHTYVCLNVSVYSINMYVRTYLVYADDRDLENVRKMLITFVILPKCGCDSTHCRTRLGSHVNKRWVDIYAIFQIASKLRKLFTRLIYALARVYFCKKWRTLLFN